MSTPAHALMTQREPVARGGVVRGFCPRVWTPMQSGDGLLVRVRPGQEGLTSSSLRALVSLAQRFGNGQLEATRRANLQLRGIEESGLAPLQEQLLALDLAPESAREEQRQLLLVDPLAGLDPDCAELLPLARDIERALREAPLAEALSPKLLLVLEGGAPLPVSCDMRITLRRQAPGYAWLSFGDAPQPLAALRVEQVAAAVVALLGALGEPPFAGVTRLRELAARGQLTELLARLPLITPAPPLSPAAPRALIGLQHHWFGLAIPFGAGAAADWLTIAELAERHAAGTVRFSPDRVLLLPGVLPASATLLARAAHEAGLIVSAADPLLHAVACPGAPACSAALGETRALARSLARAAAPLLAAGATLHVSGCSKSCAHSGPAHFTLVHDMDGAKLGLMLDALDSTRTPALSLHDAHARLAQLAQEPARDGAAKPMEAP